MTSIPTAKQVRNYVMCLVLFVGVAAVWAYYIYVAFGASLFREQGRPDAAAMAAQVGVRIVVGRLPFPEEGACIIAASSASFLGAKKSWTLPRWPLQWVCSVGRHPACAALGCGMRDPGC